MLGIHEHKITNRNTRDVQKIIKRYGLKYICTNTDESPSKGSMLVWNPKKLGQFQVAKCANDGPNKRIAYLQLTAGRGIKINITCSYMENIQLGETPQDQFYKYLKERIPDTSDTKSLYIDGGDINCNITPQQRTPYRGMENNDMLLNITR